MNEPPTAVGVRESAPGRRRSLFSWALYDWANSPYPTVIVTFVFPVYFQRQIVGDPVAATAMWGYAISLSALAVALLAPLAGAIADASANRKPWLLGSLLLTAGAGAGLWFATPDAGSIMLVLVLVAVGNFGFEFGMVFYNAMLPHLASPGRLGRLSGQAWAMGYAGGLACLMVALYGLIEASPAPFGLDPERAEPVRAVAVLVSLWFLVFGWPLFVFTRDLEPTGLGPGAAVRAGAAKLRDGLKAIRKAPNILRYLIARMIYIDGLNTLFAFGGIYAAGTFDMEMADVLLFGVALNVTAAIGAFGFGWIDDRIGAKPTVLISLVALAVLGSAILVVETQTMFWALGLGLGVFVGPVQSASRSLMARIVPPALTTEMFGLYALSGKATSFLGPWLVAVATTAFASQRAGMAVIMVFFVIGLLLMLPVKETRE